LIEILELALRGTVEHTTIIQNVHAEIGVAGDTGAIAVALFA
jgi:hypothetical protein